MEVELCADILSSEHSTLILMGIFAHGVSGRHVILRENSQFEAFEDWIDSLGSRQLRDEINLAFDEGDQKATSGGRRRRIKVSAGGQKDYRPDEALLLLGYPFRVLLENGRSDRDFLLAFAEPATRQALRDAAEQGWLLFETGGGVGEVKKRLQEFEKTAWAKERFYCLIDSDAKDEHTSPDTQGEVKALFLAIAQILDVEAGQIGKVLERRAIENYLDFRRYKQWLCTGLQSHRPAQIASDWDLSVRAQSEPTIPTNKREFAFLATLAMEHTSDRWRKFFDFSEGRGESGRRTSNSVWNELNESQKGVLRGGLGKELLRNFFAVQAGATGPALSETSGELTRVLSTIQGRM